MKRFETAEKLRAWIVDHPAIDELEEVFDDGNKEIQTIHECEGKLYEVRWYGHENGIFLEKHFSHTGGYQDYYTVAEVERKTQMIENVWYENVE